MSILNNAVRFFRRCFAASGADDGPGDLSDGRDLHERAKLPRTAYEVTRAATIRGMVIPDPCMPGVLDNLALLDSHANTLLGDPPRCGR